MKKLIFSLLTVIICLGLLGCGQKENKISLPDNIEKITISAGPARTFSYTDSAKIEKLVAYFEGLELRPSNKNPSNTKYVGFSWNITIEAGWETINMIHFSTFFLTPDGNWFAISYDQSEEFQDILEENIPEELPDNIPFKTWREE